ncbi:hypothetical protein GCM10028827_17710 [Mucilaginibacter myungsuensis]
MKRIFDSLKATNQKLPTEKVHLHTDKAFYNIGDTIWFKAYVVNNVTGKGTNMSNRLYVTMQDDSLNVIDRISVRLVNGIGWAQFPIRKIQYLEGNFTLWANTTWMQNFQSYYSRRFYFGQAMTDAWLVTSDTKIDSVNGKSRISVSLALNRTDKLLSPVTLKDVEVRIYDRDRYLFKKKMRTGVDGSLKFTEDLKDRVDGKRVRAQITSLDPIDTNKILKVPLTIDRSNKIDLQFLPEGGKLVAGLKSTVGFKAIGEDGRGTNVAGDVFDSKGKKVASFKALHKGMGAFEFTPQPGSDSLNRAIQSWVNKRPTETYTARITEPQGVTEEYQLPKVEPFGTVIHLENVENANHVKITLAGLNSVPLDSGITMVATAGGALRYAQKVMIDTKELIVEKKAFPTGPVRFTLFKGITPLNERVVFIDHHDQLQMKITPHKPSYGKRDSVSLSIEVKDKNGNPVAGRFSLSVTDDRQTKVDTLGDLDATTSLLLTGNLTISKIKDFKKMYLKDFEEYFVKGEIESPGYYIHRTDKKAWEALDNLMLTQAWADHPWTKVFGSEKKIWFKPQNTQSITGTVLNMSGKPIPNANVWIYSKKPALDGKEVTDKNGVFAFRSLLAIDSGSFFFQAVNANLKPLALSEVDIDRAHFMLQLPFFNYPILPWYVNTDSTLIDQAKRLTAWANAAYPKGVGTLLKEVKIKQTKIIRGSYNEIGPGKADYIFDENDIKRSGLTNLYEFLSRNIPGLRFMHGYNSRDEPIIIVKYNGLQISPKLDFDQMVINDFKNPWGYFRRSVDAVEELSKFNLSDIRGIELAVSDKYTHFKGPMMAITSYSGVGGKTQYANASFQFYRPVPITPPKLFYTPKYAIKSKLTFPDYRPTVHWEPNIVTDKNGKATVTFYTSDSDGGLSINLQGMSADGRTGSLLYKLPAKSK